MRVFVEAVGVLAPGLPDWAHAQPVLSGAGDYCAAAMDPPLPASLLPAERRRSSPTVRLAIAVAEQALQQTRLAADQMAMVFSSCEGAGVITHQLCEVLAGSRDVSPTQFHNSVHNAPSGYYSIAMNARLGASSIAHGRWSFAAGLLAAVTQVCAEQLPVLFVCYDSPLPAPLSEVMPITEATAIALVLTPEPGDQSIAAWHLNLAGGKGDADWPAWTPPAWRANPSARGFAALATLADPFCTSTALPLSPELKVWVSRC
jgi:hypothetical protein